MIALIAHVVLNPTTIWPWRPLRCFIWDKMLTILEHLIDHFSRTSTQLVVESLMTIFVGFHGVWAFGILVYFVSALSMPHCYVYRCRAIKNNHVSCPALGFHPIIQASLLNAYHLKYIHKVRILELCSLICPQKYIYQFLKHWGCNGWGSPQVQLLVWSSSNSVGGSFIWKY